MNSNSRTTTYDADEELRQCVGKSMCGTTGRWVGLLGLEPKHRTGKLTFEETVLQNLEKDIQEEKTQLISKLTSCGWLKEVLHDTYVQADMTDSLMTTLPTYAHEIWGSKEEPGHTRNCKASCSLDCRDKIDRKR